VLLTGGLRALLPLLFPLLCAGSLVGPTALAQQPPTAPPSSPSGPDDPLTDLTAQDEAPSADGSHWGTPGTGSLTTQLGFYRHADSIADGNPFIDEDLLVIEPILIFDHNVSDRWGYSLELAYDYVSSASIDRLSEFPEQSGASGDNYAGARFGSRHRLSATSAFDWHLGYSFEYDYRSLALGGGYSTWAPDDSWAESYSLDAYLDDVDLIRWNGVEEGSDTRSSLALTWSRSQLLSPRWNGELAATLSYQTGFLSTPYNPVAIEDPTGPLETQLDVDFNGSVVPEALPDTRLRGAVTARARRYLGPGRAFEGIARLYADDWGIGSIALEPRYLLPLSPRSQLSLGYRFYLQTAADDFSESFGPDIPEFRTQDPELADFDAHTLSAGLALGELAADPWLLGVSYTLRSDGLDALWISLNKRWSW
jgi:hypothetical protein